MDCICISHQGANTDRVNLLCMAETRLLLIWIEPDQDILSGTLQQQQEVWVGQESSLSNAKEIRNKGGLSGNFGFSGYLIPSVW